MYDWLICGAGITGAALGYELQKLGFRVAIIDRFPNPANATRFSYGGIPYWSGTTPLLQQLCQEAIERYPTLGEELGQDIGFRWLKLILTVQPEEDREFLEKIYSICLHQPQWVTPAEAQELEPLLNPQAIQGALVFDHAQADPESLVRAYLEAFLNLGGTVIYEEVLQLLEQGVKTHRRDLGCAGVIVCAGGMSRRLLRQSGLEVPIFFTHADLIETEPSELCLRTFVMPANLKRLEVEFQGAMQREAWAEDQSEILYPSFDIGGAPLLDGRMRLGQISRLHPNPAYIPEPTTEGEIRSGIRHFLPSLADLPGIWHHCLVAFSEGNLPLIGQINDYWWIFSGFTSPFVFVPPLARRFAKYLHSRQDEVIPYLFRQS
ncbi:MAG: FAD-dependent oxidoreductase [Pseudanabaenaceae cyanobacterium SKYGB_i_bin29]|nr:FAD-binding oxidoreductase [Pseudanabaenaceae cyanobacterium SKYG29]MDW8421442.1 FAD-dependent oxidoreductase [Pseudanabaenaceae cyanobacterium SKYGB_i_bin29]